MCIGLSRTHYCAEVKSLREEQKQKAKGKHELPGSQIVYHSLFEISQLCPRRGQRRHQSHKAGQKHQSQARESGVLPSRGAASGIESSFPICFCGRFCLVKSTVLSNLRLVIITMSTPLISQVLQSALVTFDLMESLIVRIEEIAVEKLRTPQVNWRHFVPFFRWLTSMLHFPFYWSDIAPKCCSECNLNNSADLNPIYSISLNISQTGLLSMMWARARDILLQIIPLYGLLVTCRQTTEVP